MTKRFWSEKEAFGPKIRRACSWGDTEKERERRRERRRERKRRERRRERREREEKTAVFKKVTKLLLSMASKTVTRRWKKKKHNK